MRTTWIVIALLATSAFAAPPCAVTGLPAGPAPSGIPFHLDFDNAATRYVATASVRGSAAQQPKSWIIEAQGDSQIVLEVPRVAADTMLDVVIFGSAASNDEVTCMTRAAIPITPYGALASVSDRVVVPIAGNTPGAHGSQWKTSLQLSGFGSGTIYFRPLGTFHGDDRDPHIRYELGPLFYAAIPAIIFVDDISATLGVDGIGNLDIVPDFIDEGLPPFREGYLAPNVEARIWNDAGEGGTFGATVRALTPTVVSRSALRIIVPWGYPDRVRVNVGVRTFDHDASIEKSIFYRELDAFARLGTFDMPANSFRQVPLAELFPDAQAGDLLGIGTNDTAVPLVAYYSVTDNVSNDPEIHTQPETANVPRLRDVVVPMSLYF